MILRSHDSMNCAFSWALSQNGDYAPSADGVMFLLLSLTWLALSTLGGAEPVPLVLTPCEPEQGSCPVYRLRVRPSGQKLSIHRRQSAHSSPVAQHPAGLWKSAPSLCADTLLTHLDKDKNKRRKGGAGEERSFLSFTVEQSR